MIRKLAAVSFAAMAMLVATSAAAAEEDGGVSAAVFGGYGFGKDPNAYKLGFGGRVGYTLPNPNVYLGGRFDYFLGATKEEGDKATVYAKTSVGLYFFAVEGGYDLHMDNILIRPYVGLGMAKAHASAEMCIMNQCQEGSATSDDSKFTLIPGAVVGYKMDKLLLFVDPHYYMVTGDGGSDLSAFAVTAGAGYKF